jgi:antitoxin component YwqK of YwqJK toxin-antitoxin module
MKLLGFIFALSLLLSMHLSAQIRCKNPKKHTVHTKALKSTYVNCKREVMTYWYNDKGGIKSKVNFKNGKEECVYTSYHDNGKVKLTVAYVNGQKHGIQKVYYDNG